MKSIRFLGLLALFVVSVDNVSAWDQEELEIFDLVEEINQNFYTVLKVEQVIDFISEFLIDLESEHNCIWIIYFNRTPKRLIFVKHSEAYHLSCIQIKMMHQMPMYSSEILYQFMKCLKIQQKEKSEENYENENAYYDYVWQLF